MSTYAFIDASNLFYGGVKSLGWKIDYNKLLKYLKNKYSVSRIFYFGGVEIHNFLYDYQNNETVPIKKLYFYLNNLSKNKSDNLLIIKKHLQKIKFYKNLESFNYELFLKPIKAYQQENGLFKRKANCDVDMTFYLMKEKDNFNKAIILSGDGDFLPVLKYLKVNGKEVIILSRSLRTAKEIKQFAGSDFRDFDYLKNLIEFK